MTSPAPGEDVTAGDKKGNLAAKRSEQTEGGTVPKAPPFGGAGAQRLRGFSPILLHYIGRVKHSQV